MKKILGLLLLTVIAGSAFAQQNVTLMGKIDNPHSDSLVISDRMRQFNHKVDVNAEGELMASFAVPTVGSYMAFDGTEFFNLFLADGYQLMVMTDANKLDESLQFSGMGAESNNYLAERTRMQATIDFEEIMFLDRPEFDVERAKILQQANDLLNNTYGVHATLLEEEKVNLGRMTQGIEYQYAQMQELKAFNGQPCPAFEGYENHAGGETSLSDLKGKYVYIDFWATWCGPCKAEIPALKQLEKDYHDKNIEFVSISIDRVADYETWKTMVTEEELTGVQLYAKGDRGFPDALKVRGIPRFVILDPEGVVVRSNAPRPSTESVRKVFEELGI